MIGGTHVDHFHKPNQPGRYRRPRRRMASPPRVERADDARRLPPALWQGRSPGRSREVALSGLITNAEGRESIPARMQASMLDRPSDDEVSRQILGVFMRHRIPASGILQRNHFFDVRDGDFQRGLNKAVANNWITIDLRNRYRYQLTAKGYAVGRMIDPVLGQPTNFVKP